MNKWGAVAVIWIAVGVVGLYDKLGFVMIVAFFAFLVSIRAIND